MALYLRCVVFFQACEGRVVVGVDDVALLCCGSAVGFVAVEVCYVVVVEREVCVHVQLLPLGIQDPGHQVNCKIKTIYY